MLQVGHPCGLCNRLDVISTGYVLARDRGEEAIEVLWPLNDRHMPVRFHDLFGGLPSGQVVEQEIGEEVSRSYAVAQRALPHDYRRSDFYLQMLRRLLANAVPAVAEQVEAFAHTHQFEKPGSDHTTIGVHVRRSESPLPLVDLAQPLRFYEAVMKSFPPGTRFFVSTDSQEAFRWLQGRFGSRVFQRDKAHDNRSSVDGVREGLIDMLLLSRCSAIIGTFGSSFSAVAAQAGGRPLLMLRAFPDIDEGWSHFSRWRWLWAYRHFVRESTIYRRSFDWTIRPQAARVPRIPARLLRIIRSYLRTRSTLSGPPSPQGQRRDS